MIETEFFFQLLVSLLTNRDGFFVRAGKADFDPG